MKNNIVFLLSVSLIFSLNSCNLQTTKAKPNNFEYQYGGIVRGNKDLKEIALVFTGGDYADGGFQIMSTLERQKIKASFFYTGDFYNNEENQKLISLQVKQGHYLGAHSDKHLLYCDWTNLDSLLVTKDEFTIDLQENYTKMEKFGIKKNDAPYFLPPYEWYNDTISSWTKDLNLQLVNMTRGTLSAADYTTPEMKNYRNSEVIYNSIINYEEQTEFGLNGFMLLIHIGTHPDRKDKFYYKLDDLIKTLKNKGYRFLKVDELLSVNY